MHPFRRDDALRRLADEEFDVLVIGGGVTGAGVALDAASRGLKTALVEKGDFASGTSSKSSKMIHGGIRYLQQREFRLVYENLAERQRLLDNAPHLVSPAARSSSRSSGVTASSPRPWPAPTPPRCGCTTSPAAGASASGTARSTKDEALAHLPTLNTDHLVAGFLYFDARADDARLTLTAGPHGGLRIRRGRGQLHAGRPPRRPARDGSADGAVVRPVPDDETSEFPIRARVVVNATGVWADEVRALDEGRDPHAIRPAKGVHVTVPADRLPCDIAAVIPVPKDKRSIFVVSWPGTDLVYLGTTDTDYAGPLDDPGLHARGRRLPARRGQQPHHLAPHPGRRDRRLGRAAPPPGAAGQGRPRLGAHGRPLAPPHRQHVDATAS